MFDLWNLFNVYNIIIIMENGQHFEETIYRRGQLPIKFNHGEKEYEITASSIYNTRARISRIHIWFLLGVNEYLAIFNEGGQPIKPFYSNISPALLYNVNESTILKKGLLEKFKSSIFDNPGNWIKIIIILAVTYYLLNSMGAFT